MTPFNSKLQTVTVLFCDIVGSTRLAVELDIEELDSLIGAFHASANAIAKQHCGARFKPLGDGARIVFGHPDSHEDSARLAVECAIALLQEIPHLGGSASGPLSLRVGIAHGEAVLASANGNGLRPPEDINGLVVHRAERLVKSCAPNEIAVDEVMRDLVGGRFVLRGVAPRPLQGLPGQTPTWIVERPMDPSEQHVNIRRPARGKHLVVGRQVQIDVLHREWMAARSGTARFIVLRGEPGIGKSLLARDTALRATAEGARRVDLEFTARTSRIPLFPFPSMIAQLSGVPANHGDRGLAHDVLPWIETILPGSQADDVLRYICGTMRALDGPSSSDLLRRRALDLLLAVLAVVSKSTPTIVVVDDLQWADATSLELLDQLQGLPVGHRLLVIGTTRPTLPPEVGAPQSHMILDVGALDRVSCHQLLDTLLSETGHQLPDSVCRAIVERAEGVPLFLEELVKSALAAPRTDAGSLPESLRHALEARLFRWPAYIRTVHAAAVVGRECPLPILSSLTGQSRQDLSSAVAVLAAEGIFDDVNDTHSLRFRHALIQESIYGTILRTERDQLHLAAAALLASRLEDDPSIKPDVVAHHFRAARRNMDAGRWFLRASVLTNDAAAYLESIGHAQQGLACLRECVADEPDTGKLERQLLVQLGVARTALHGYAAPEVQEAWNLARTVSAPLQTDDDYAASRGIATYHLVKGDVVMAHSLSANALAYAERSAKPEYLIDALSVHGYTSLYVSSVQEASTSLRRCLELHAREGGHRLRYPAPQDAATAAWALLPTAEWLLGRPHQAERAIANGMDHVTRLNRPFDTALFHAWTAGIRFTQRSDAEALRHAAIAAEISQKYGYTIWLGVGVLMSALSEACLRPTVETITRATETLMHASTSGATLNGPYYLWGLARALAAAGDRLRAAHVISQALAQSAITGETRMDSELLLLQVQLGADEVDAPAVLRKAFELAIEHEAPMTAYRIHCHAMRLGSGPVSLDDALNHPLSLPGDDAEFPALLAYAKAAWPS